MFTDAISAIKVLEYTFRDPSDKSDLPGLTIKFAMAAEPRADIDADERQATDAVVRATEAVNPISSTPAAIELLTSVVDASTNVVTEAQTFETTWGVLLQRMELFNKIVTDIAQVFRLSVSTTPQSECRTDSPIYVAGLVCHISCEPGQSVT